MGLTRTSGAAEQAHLQSICLREQNMLDAIRFLSTGRDSGSGSGKSRSRPAAQATGSSARAEKVKVVAVPGATGGGAAETVAKPKAASVNIGSKTVVGQPVQFGNYYDNGNDNGGSIPGSPTSDVTAETYFSETPPSSVAASSTLAGSVPPPVGAAAAAAAEEQGGSRPPPRTAALSHAGAGVSSPLLGIPPLPSSGTEAAAAAAAAASAMGFEEMTLPVAPAPAAPAPATPAPAAPAAPTGPPPPKAASAQPRAAEVSSPALRASPSSEATVVPPPPSLSGSDPVEARGDMGGSLAPADPAGGGVGDENPWNKELPATLSPAARRYAATYLATCVRQALQRNPDQMARCGRLCRCWVLVGGDFYFVAMGLVVDEACGCSCVCVVGSRRCRSVFCVQSFFRWLWLPFGGLAGGRRLNLTWKHKIRVSTVLLPVSLDDGHNGGLCPPVARRNSRRLPGLSLTFLCLEYTMV